jgi:Uma2 family endonuclease
MNQTTFVKNAGPPALSPGPTLDVNQRLSEEIFYPESDGEPMAETDFQREPLTYAVSSLRLHFQDRADLYVSGNLFIYYEEGNPAAVIAPDVFVVLGVPQYDRRTYKVWAEGKAPDVVIEITSKETRAEDEKKKPALYQQLGVKEYFQYDPTGDYLKPPLKGRWLDEHGEYQPMSLSRLPGGLLSLYSYLLNLELHLEAGRLRLFDPEQEVYLLSHEEEQRARRLAEQQATLEKMARQKAQQQATLEKVTRQKAEQQATLEKMARQEAEQQATLEKAARQEAEQQATLEKVARQEAEQQATLEKMARQEAEQQATLEKMARQEAEARANDAAAHLERLKAELERLRANISD